MDLKRAKDCFLMPTGQLEQPLHLKPFALINDDARVVSRVDLV